MFELYIFLFGLCVGSFLNVVINRLETGEDIVKKPSHCPKCGHRLAWYELIPVISFLVLRRKCRRCGEKISWQYPMVELSTALIFLAAYTIKLSAFSYQLSAFDYLGLIYVLIVFSLFIVIFVYDYKHYEIPNEIVYSGIAISLAYDLYLYPWDELRFYLLAALLPAAFFLSLIIFSKGEWMGMGDVKLALFMGLFLGAVKSVVAFLLAFWGGAIIGIILLLLKKKGMKSQLPFGPFLVLGTLAAFFFGEQLIDLYLRMMY